MTDLRGLELRYIDAGAAGRGRTPRGEKTGRATSSLMNYQFICELTDCWQQESPHAAGFTVNLYTWLPLQFLLTIFPCLPLRERLPPILIENRRSTVNATSFRICGTRAGS